MGAITKHNLLKRVQSSLTPYILEERELRVTQMDIFSRLMMDRIIWLAPVNDRMSTVVQAHYYF
jgi:ATP-dependent Clp protease protease subunit